MSQSASGRERYRGLVLGHGALVITGSCLCGRTRFEATAAPRRVTHCHCSMCRRSMGAAVATFATFEANAVRWSHEPQRYDSSERAWRGFCPTCGASVCFGYNPRPERVYVAVGIFDDPDAYPAGFHDHREEKIAWLEVDEKLPDAADFRR